MKALEEKLEQAKKETAEVEDRNKDLQAEISKLENTKVERENEYAQAEQEKKDILIPEIERMMQLIRQTKESIARGSDEILEQDAKNETLSAQIEAQETKQQQLRD